MTANAGALACVGTVGELPLQKTSFLSPRSCQTLLPGAVEKAFLKGATPLSPLVRGAFLPPPCQGGFSSTPLSGGLFFHPLVGGHRLYPPDKGGQGGCFYQSKGVSPLLSKKGSFSTTPPPVGFEPRGGGERSGASMRPRGGGDTIREITMRTRRCIKEPGRRLESWA